jgi:misacylated tRNA(Ala) deacylase
MTDLLYQNDAYLKEFTARVTAADGSAVALDRTDFYDTGGGQPHDTGTLTADGRALQVSEVRKQGTTSGMRSKAMASRISAPSCAARSIGSAATG